MGDCCYFARRIINMKESKTTVKKLKQIPPKKVYKQRNDKRNVLRYTKTKDVNAVEMFALLRTTCNYQIDSNKAYDLGTLFIM